MKIPTIAILAALGGLQTVVAQQVGNTMIWVDATTCDPWAKSNGFPAAAGSGGLFTTALGILQNIVDANFYRMLNPSKQSLATLPANVLAWERYRLNSIYDAFFGNNTNTTRGSQGVWNVGFALSGVHYLWAPSNGKPVQIFVACDDAPYLSKNSSGNVYYTDPFYHSTIPLNGDRPTTTQEVTSGCATNGRSGYRNKNTIHWFQNIILCTKNMNLPLGFTSKGLTAFGSGTTLDVAGKSWIGAIFTQALWSTGIVGLTPSPHGFAAVHAIRNTRDVLYNPDAHKFFTFSLILDNLFWASGVGQTPQQEYTSLQKTAAARGVNWISGWTPPPMLGKDAANVGAIPTA
ncbi:hypothetical protein TrVFT333_009604 [Trichoderma virens FT-333]|nr:hypothetical protein TrVFT333_009604 [Trichoderma virens FT-333]